VATSGDEDGGAPRRGEPEGESRASLAFRLFGRLRWEPPPHVSRGARAAAAPFRRLAAWRRRDPRRFAGAAVALFVAVATAAAATVWWWWQPTPETVPVTLLPPGPTPLEKDAVVSPLVVEFGDSAARLADVGRPVAEGVALQPVIAGTWTWQDDRRLQFQPAADWPVATRYELRLDRALFPSHVRLAGYTHRFSTAEFSATITSAAFHQDPIDPSDKRVVATVKFSHPVDPRSLEPRVAMRLTGDPDALPEGREQDFAASATYDAFLGEAYLRSERLPIPPDDATMRLTIAAGVRSERGGNALAEIRQEVRVPGMYAYFRIEDAHVELVRDAKGDPEQVLLVATSGDVAADELASHLEAYLLPVDLPAGPGREAVSDHAWGNLDEIGPDVLAASERIQTTALPAERDHVSLHSFRVDLPPERHAYVRVTRGVRAYGGYLLARDFDQISLVPEFPREVEILHAGSVLPLAGERKLSVMARGVGALRISVGEVLPGQINHLVSQSYGSLANPAFTRGIGPDDLAAFHREVRRLEPAPPQQARYTALDFSGADGRSEPRRGLHFLEVEGWNSKRRQPIGPSDRRLLLITDLGVLVKAQRDGSRAVFVQSIATGLPVANASVEVLGRNGVPVAERTTDASGFAALPSLSDLDRERSPVAYVVRHGSDLSFLPWERRDRALDLSRFDVGGIQTPETGERLRAFLFSDRGIYRPGDVVHAGLVVRSSVWRTDTAGVPVELDITDPRGRSIDTRKLRLATHGFDEIELATRPDSPTGQYALSLHVVKDGKRDSLLGSTTVRVEEFLPDRMQIEARLDPARAAGWVSPERLSAHVSLKNLYGTPASARRVSARVYLTPGFPQLPGFDDYRFADPLEADKSFQERLEDGTTDAEGRVAFDLDLARFADATYALRLEAEGFEAEGGRSVVTEARVLVSPLPQLVGWKPDGDLAYVHRGSARSVDLVAVDPAGERTAVADLEAAVVELRFVSVLTRQPNGTYAYESRQKELPVGSRTVSIPREGLAYALPTDRPGDFALLVRDAKKRELARAPFSVVGDANLTRELERNAELRLKLDRRDYEPGQDIEVEIQAPYTGAGLLTIEADRVYGHRWFRSDTTASVQRIAVPEALEGSGYVVVSFVRAPDSEEVFMSPLSSAAAPFSVSRARQTVSVELEAPDLARPGEPFEIGYRSDRASRIAVFAVDEGILQVAGYATPDPLGFFFEKRALEVETLQMLDLILPEFSIAARRAASGGDTAFGLDSNLNPFRRWGALPAVYWAGIVDAGPERKTLAYAPPDGFSGTLRIMAVAVSADGVGAAERRALVRGHFALSPNVPTTVAPGDRFEVSVTVANQAEGSGENAACEVALEADGGVAVEGGVQTLAISEGSEATARFAVVAQEALGPARLRFSARTGELRTKHDVDLSVRPPMPYRVSTVSGHFAGGEAKAVVARKLRPELRRLEVTASSLPIALAGGLLRYLDDFPYLCTEQLVSRGFPALVLLRHPEFGLDRERARAQVAETLRILQGRQNGDGAFGSWAANSHVNETATLHALDFLLTAREQGHAVSPDMVEAALGWTERFAGEKRRTLEELRIQARAVYLLARSGRVTTKLLVPLRERLEERYEKTWREDLAAAHLAASYALLQQPDEADALIRRVPFQTKVEEDYELFFYDELLRTSQLLLVLARHFPARLTEVGGDALLRWVEPVALGRYNTHSTAYTIAAMAALADATGERPPDSLVLEAVGPAGARTALHPEGRLFARAEFPPEAESLRVASGSRSTVFYQVLQAGFDAELPAEAVANGLEIQREYRNADGAVVTRAALGDELTVHLRIRGIGGRPYQNVAVVDLLPGGFEIVRAEGLRTGDLPGSDWRVEYADIREDRLLLFGTVGAGVSTFTYPIKATNAGTYRVPPPFAESMYDRRLQAQGVGGEITVESAP
jgi:hypothetical protein